MLVLSRKLGEQVLIGNGVVVTVLSIRGRLVRLGIDAPQEVAIRRSTIQRVGPQAVIAETAHPVMDSI